MLGPKVPTVTTMGVTEPRLLLEVTSMADWLQTRKGERDTQGLVKTRQGPIGAAEASQTPGQTQCQPWNGEAGWPVRTSDGTTRPRDMSPALYPGQALLGGQQGMCSDPVHGRPAAQLSTQLHPAQASVCSLPPSLPLSKAWTGVACHQFTDETQAWSGSHAPACPMFPPPSLCHTEGTAVQRAMGLQGPRPCPCSPRGPALCGPALTTFG